MKKLTFILLIIVILFIETTSFADYYPYDDNKSVSLIYSSDSGTYIVDNNSTKPRKLSKDEAINIVQNGGYLYYSTREYELKRLNMSTKEIKKYEGVNSDWGYKLIIGNKIYFPGTDWCEPYNYYVMNLDGSGLTKLFSGIIDKVFIDKGIVYIIGYDETIKSTIGSSICRITKDGKKKTFVCKGWYSVFDGEWIYYSDRYDKDGNALEVPISYRVKKDFSKIEGVKRIINPASKFNGYGYFVDYDFDSDTDKLYRMNIKTQKINVLDSEEDITFNTVNANRIIYAYKKDNRYYLAKYDLKLKKKIILTEVTNEKFAFDSKYIYFQLNNSIYKILPSGKGKRLIAKVKSLESELYDWTENYILFKDGWLYFEAGDSFYKVKADGSKLTLLSSISTYSYFFYRNP